MARKPRPKIEEAQPKTLRMLPEIQTICQRVNEHLPTAHGNQQLHDDQVLGVLLCAFFEPACRSQRSIDQLSAVPAVNQLLDGQRVARSTLSDALQRFDTAAVESAIRLLKRRLPQLKHQDPVLERLSQQILAADGSSFRMAGEVAWALQRTRDRQGRIDSQAKLHLQLDVRRGTMTELAITGNAESPGGASEQKVLAQRLTTGAIYLLDRGYCGFELLRGILAAESHFVLRLKKDLAFRSESPQPLSEADRQAGIGSDERGLLGKADEQLSEAHRRGENRRDKPPTQPLRLVTVWDPTQQQWVRLLTDLLEVEAWVIAYLYRCRWFIELFFRWLKITAGFAHLLSQSANGVTVQMYVAMIGSLLICLHTGRPPSQYSLFAMHLVASGQASYADMLPGLLRLERERDLERKRLARKKAAAKQG